MKIVQSLWSKPTFKSYPYNTSDRNNGGWKDKRYNYMSWAFSCLQFRKFYDDVELVTDKLGYDLLINKLHLPYTSCKILLDDLNDYHADLWAIGKLYAYSIQNSPFIHADGDIYIFKELDQKINSAGLIAQNIEYDHSSYNHVFAEIKNYFSFVPPSIIKSKQKFAQIIGVNAGIIGGSDISFFKDYVQSARLFIDANISALHKINTGLFNLIFEQFLFHSLADERNLKIEYLFEDVNVFYDGFADLFSVPGKVQFVHPVSTYKKKNIVCDLLEYQLRINYPEYYFNIQNLLYTSQI